jgi:hypothetical protein
MAKTLHKTVKANAETFDLSNVYRMTWQYLPPNSWERALTRPALPIPWKISGFRRIFYNLLPKTLSVNDPVVTRLSSPTLVRTRTLTGIAHHVSPDCNTISFKYCTAPVPIKTVSRSHVSEIVQLVLCLILSAFMHGSTYGGTYENSVEIHYGQGWMEEKHRALASKPKSLFAAKWREVVAQRGPVNSSYQTDFGTFGGGLAAQLPTDPLGYSAAASTANLFIGTNKVRLLLCVSLVSGCLCNVVLELIP